jgi:hypothetical protein
VNGFNEYAFWSAYLGGPAVRLSIHDRHGDEYHMTLPQLQGQAMRDARAAACEAIEEAIRLKCLPGEVRVID